MVYNMNKNINFYILKSKNWILINICSELLISNCFFILMRKNPADKS